MQAVMNGTQPVASSLLEQSLQALLQQSQQTNVTLGQLAQEMRTMNEQLFHRQQGLAPALAVTSPTPSEATGQEAWARKTDRGKCAEIGLTKTRSLNKWKVNFYMYGINKPASFYARDGYEQIMRFLGEVWPEANADVFSEELFNDRNKAVRDANPERVYEQRFTLPPFMVEFTDSKPKQMENGMKISFRYAERVWPMG